MAGVVQLGARWQLLRHHRGPRRAFPFAFKALIAYAGLYAIEYGLEIRAEPKVIAIVTILVVSLCSVCLYAALHLINVLAPRVEARLDASLTPFGLAGFLLVIGVSLLLGLFLLSLEGGSGLASAMLAGLASVCVAVLGAGVLKLSDRLMEHDEERRALREDLVTAYLLCDQPNAASDWERVQLAARIVNAAISSPLGEALGDDLYRVLGKNIAGKVGDPNTLQRCIRLLKGPNDDQWAHHSGWHYYFDSPPPEGTTRAIAAIREKIAGQPIDPTSRTDHSQSLLGA